MPNDMVSNANTNDAMQESMLYRILRQGVTLHGLCGRVAQSDVRRVGRVLQIMSVFWSKVSLSGIARTLACSPEDELLR